MNDIIAMRFLNSEEVTSTFAGAIWVARLLIVLGILALGVGDTKIRVTVFFKDRFWPWLVLAGWMLFCVDPRVAFSSGENLERVGGVMSLLGLLLLTTAQERSDTAPERTAISEDPFYKRGFVMAAVGTFVWALGKVYYDAIAVSSQKATLVLLILGCAFLWVFKPWRTRIPLPPRSPPTIALSPGTLLPRVAARTLPPPTTRQTVFALALGMVTVCLWIFSASMAVVPLMFVGLSINRDFDANLDLIEKGIVAVAGLTAIVLSTAKTVIPRGNERSMRAVVACLLGCLLTLLFIGMLKSLLFELWKGGFSSAFSKGFDLAVSTFWDAARKPAPWMRHVLLAAVLVAYGLFLCALRIYLLLLLPAGGRLRRIFGFT